MKIKNDKLNLKEKFLKMYLEKASYDELKEINNLLEKEDYLSINSKVEEFKQNLLNNKKINFNTSEGSSDTPRRVFSDKEKENTKEIDEQTFELYCILKLIEEYLNEKDDEKKKSLKTQIERALEYYRNLQPEKTRSL